MSDEDFMTHVLNNLTKECDVVFVKMESRLMLKENNPNKLTIEDVQDKLSGSFDRIHGQIANHKKETVRTTNDESIKGSKEVGF